MGRFVGTVCDNSVHIPVFLDDLVIYCIKRYAVMHIARGYFYLKNKAVHVASCMGFVGKLPFVVTLDKQATVRVRHALCYCLCLFCLLAPLLLLL